MQCKCKTKHALHSKAWPVERCCVGNPTDVSLCIRYFVIQASHKTEHYEPCSLVQPGAAWCSLVHQWPCACLQDFLQRGLSVAIRPMEYGVAGLLAAQSIDAIDTDNFDPAEKNSLRGLSHELASRRSLLKVSYPKKSMVLPSRSARRSLQRLDLRKRRCVQVHRFRSPNSGPAGPRCRMFRKPWSCIHHRRHGETKTNNMSRATYVAEQFFQPNMSLKSN